MTVTLARENTLPDTEDTTQWKIQRLQVINWGGFEGYTKIDFALTATLLTGESGTGKSTLLDAYIALMMDSNAAFNNASNTTVGRARSADQRNILSYMRGKTDSSRDLATDQLRDDVLRGDKSATWSAIAATFINDSGRQFTATRLFYAPASATRGGDVRFRLATLHGPLDLRDMAPYAEEQFTKKDILTQFPKMSFHDSYAAFSQDLYTHLGIGANGAGREALRLLVSIQGSRQVTSVDGLFKTMVLEKPATYAAADKAISHFNDLATLHESMQSAADKIAVLSRIPGLHDSYDSARAEATLIDTFKVHANTGEDTPFTLWSLHTEATLLTGNLTACRNSRTTTAASHAKAQATETTLRERIAEVQAEQRANGGDALERLTLLLDSLNVQRGITQTSLDTFTTRTALLGTPPTNATEHHTLNENAHTFQTGFDHTLAELTARTDAVIADGVRLTDQRNDLFAEAKSLRSRDGNIPRYLDEARRQLSNASGIPVADLPFIAELIDLAPGEEQWRTAAEVVLGGIGRRMLVNENDYARFSEAVDAERMRSKINFDGVPLNIPVNQPTRPDTLAGKLVFKDRSPFAGAVAARLLRDDYVCVNTAAELTNDNTRRVTLNGQTRHRMSGSVGGQDNAPILGFSNTNRLTQIVTNLTALDVTLGEKQAARNALATEQRTLQNVKEAHQYVLDNQWDTIDVSALDALIAERAAEQEELLATEDILRTLKATATALTADLEDAMKTRHMFGSLVETLDKDYATMIDREDVVKDELDRIERDETATVTNEQATRLNAVLAEVTADLEDADLLAPLPGHLRQVRFRLADLTSTHRILAETVTGTLTTIFDNFQHRWPNPNLGIGIESYDAYKVILDELITEGLGNSQERFGRALAEWSGEDLILLHRTFDESIESIEGRLGPINDILAGLPFGSKGDQLRINPRRLPSEDQRRFRRRLNTLTANLTEEITAEQVTNRFKEIQRFINLIREPETGKGSGTRDQYLDVRRHVEITAERLDSHGTQLGVYANLGGKSGGETQELVAFIVGSALRYQLGDESRTRPRFAAVFIDEGFVKSDSKFAGRAVRAWMALGFQLIVGAPVGQMNALEPYMDQMLQVRKSDNGYSHIDPFTPETPADIQP